MPPTVDKRGQRKHKVTQYIRWSDVTQSVVTTRSPFCGYSTTSCVELNGEDLSCYWNKIESTILRKCPYHHWLANKAHVSAITVTDISKSFTYKMAAKINRHRCGTKLRNRHPIYIIYIAAAAATPRGSSAGPLKGEVRDVVHSPSSWHYRCSAECDDDRQ